MIDATTHQIAEVIVTEMITWTPHGGEKKKRKRLDALSDRLIRFFRFSLGSAKPNLEPTTSHVSEMVIRFMRQWDYKADETKRQAELYMMAEGLRDYFAAFYVQPVQLDGLPGGHPYAPAT